MFCVFAEKLIDWHYLPCPLISVPGSMLGGFLLDDDENEMNKLMAAFLKVAA
jgi:hypothetical protein